MDDKQIEKLLDDVGAAADYAAQTSSNVEDVVTRLDEIIKLLKSISRKL
ncbi:hypothetical protein [Microbacterium sp.]